jgi:hypothetical protein
VPEAENSASVPDVAFAAERSETVIRARPAICEASVRFQIRS